MEMYRQEAEGSWSRSESTKEAVEIIWKSGTKSLAQQIYFIEFILRSFMW